MKRLLCVVPLPMAMRGLYGQTIPSDVIGYVSLTHTPIGVFAPIAPVPSGALRGRVGLELRYGSLPRGDRNNKSQAYAASALLPAGSRASVSLTAGTYKETCPDPECKHILMLGAGGQLDLTPMFTHEPTPFSIALSGDVGWSAKQFETTYLTAHAGVPVSLTLGGDPKRPRLSVWATPGFGYGRANVSGNFPASGIHTGSLGTVAGGVALFTSSPNLGVQLGVMHLATSNAKTGVGVNVMFNP